MADLTHLDEKGRARMVDVGGKNVTHRTATAWAEVLLEGGVPKGDVLAVARIAGITGGKKTSELIPLTHPIGIDSLKVEVTPDKTLPGIRLEATATTTGKTGVEMEAMTAVSIAALTVYDTLKSIEKGIVVSNVRLVYKAGGKSGEYIAE